MHKLAIIGLSLILTGCASTRSGWYYYDASNLTPLGRGNSDMGKAANDDNAIYNGDSIESLRVPQELIRKAPRIHQTNEFNDPDASILR